MVGWRRRSLRAADQPRTPSTPNSMGGLCQPLAAQARATARVSLYRIESQTTAYVHPQASDLPATVSRKQAFSPAAWLPHRFHALRPGGADRNAPHRFRHLAGSHHPCDPPDKGLTFRPHPSCTPQPEQYCAGLRSIGRNMSPTHRQQSEDGVSHSAAVLCPEVSPHPARQARLAGSPSPGPPMTLTGIHQQVERHLF